MSSKSKQLKKEALIKAMEANLGNVSHSCKAVGVTRKTYYQYMKEPDFKEAIDAINANTGDWVESQLFKLISGFGDDAPCKTSIIFYLKTRCKDRGYVERQEQELLFNDNEIKKLAVTFIDGSKDS